MAGLVFVFKLSMKAAATYRIIDIKAALGEPPMYIVQIFNLEKNVQLAVQPTSASRFDDHPFCSLEQVNFAAQTVIFLYFFAFHSWFF